MQTSKHAPTPWKQHVIGDLAYILSKTGFSVAQMGAGYADKLKKSNADFIVRAVNSHDALVNALEALKSYFAVLEGQDWRERELDEQAGAALRLARGA